MEVRGLREKERVAFAQGERGGAKPNPSLATPPLPLPGYFLESCISVATLGADTSGGLSADAGARKRAFPAWPPAAEGLLTALPPACGGSALPPGLPWRPQDPDGFSPPRDTFYHVGEAASSLRSPSPSSPASPHTPCVGGGGRGGLGGRFLVLLAGLLKQFPSSQEHKCQDTVFISGYARSQFSEIALLISR